VLAKKHPELWTNTVINMVPDDLGHVHYTHPASAFVARQKYWISKGQTEEEAYQSVLEDWQRQKRFERIELQVAMMQATEQGAEVQEKTPWQERYEEEFEVALTRRMNLDQQRRRERLESLLESRDASGETEVIELSTLDPDVTQADLKGLLSSDERAQRHFGGEAETFSVEIERLLPKKGQADYERFREFMDQSISEEVRSLIASSEMPDPARAQYFKELDSVMEAKRREEEEAYQKEQLAQQQLMQSHKEADAPAAGKQGKKKGVAKGKAKKGGAKKKKD
jgi:hypothetical protein